MKTGGDATILMTEAVPEAKAKALSQAMAELSCEP